MVIIIIIVFSALDFDDCRKRSAFLFSGMLVDFRAIKELYSC